MLSAVLEPAPEVAFREEGAGYALVIDGEVAHRLDSDQAAWTLAAWIRYQLEQGTTAAELRRMLRGRSPQEADGGAPPRKPRTAQNRGDNTPPPEEWLDIDGLLAGTVDELEVALASGDFDAALDSVLRAEGAGKARKTAEEAILARRAHVRRLAVLDGTLPELDAALADGVYDDILDELIAAERAGKQRKGAVAALEARREA